ncbi:tetratricopeptide repeat protein [Aquisphaera insulae]|uniref:tetratricopeptide repeat protein n=1 Tax=Aquisphaera insulae TaxID=2712864 RepID=UPI0013ED4EA3|nr:hypothetical protein [Aquisphaera insulae]
MFILIYIALLGWIPFCLLLFALVPARQAVVAATIGGWILLPPTGFSLPGIPDFTKLTATVFGILIGTLIFQPNRILAFRFRWFDLPTIAWWLCPSISSLVNGLGAYDALSSLFSNAIVWAFPYFIGRAYLGDREGLRDLAIGMAFSGIALIPFCLFEMKMSAVLLPRVYGFGIFEGARLGGWRPRVFFSTGLELGMWMSAASLSCAWLWKSGSLRKLGPIPLELPLLSLLITTLLCRTSGATTLLIFGLIMLWLSAHFRTGLLLCAVLLVPPAYHVARSTNIWTGEGLVRFIETYLSAERADSLNYRFRMEDILVKKALQQPAFGWGGWGRSRVTDSSGRDIVDTDGMWVIFLGTTGIVGLICWSTMMLLPAWSFVIRFPAARWSDTATAPMAIVAWLTGLYMIDCLANGFLNPAYILAMGALSNAAWLVSPTAPSTNRGRPKGGLRTSIPGPRPNGPAALGAGAAALGSPPPDARQTLADRYRSLARSLSTREADRAAAEQALAHAYDILSEIASARPGNAEALRQRRDCGNELAWLLVSQGSELGGDPARAVELARRATHDDPDRADYWTTLGAALYRAGDPGAAIEALGRSVAIRGGEGTSNDHIFLALAHARLGDVDAARDYRGRIAAGAPGRDPGGDLIATIDSQIEAHSH